MKEKARTKSGRILLALALISFLIATTEGLIYYASYPNWFFRILLILQNSIKSFFFQSSISLDGALGTVGDGANLFKTVIAYAYGVALFTAPYCTVATVYRVLGRLFHLVARLRMRKVKDHVVIFGYNEDVRILLSKSLEDPSALTGRRLHLIAASSPPQEDGLRYSKAGWLVHVRDTGALTEEEAAPLLAQWGVGKSSAVLLMEEDAAANFALLQLLLKAKGKNGAPLLPSKAKVYCRCEDRSLRRLIEDYYDGLAGAEKPFDLELFDVTELQVREMYRAHPLHSYHWTGPDKTPPAGSRPRDWNVHLLLLGFGRVGQEVLLQAMNLGVAHSENPILVDVVDRAYQEKAGLFSGELSEDAFEIGEDRVAMRSGAADGRLEIRFHQADVRQPVFRRLLAELGAEAPFTYVVVSMEDGAAAIRGMTEVQQYLLSRRMENTPVLLRMDVNRILSSYLEKNENTFRNVYRMLDRRAFLSLGLLFAFDLDRSAKEFNRIYSGIRINQSLSPDPAPDADGSWRRLSLFQRNSSRALAAHQTVKDRIIPALAEETGNRDAWRDLFVCENGGWRYPEGQSHRDFLAALAGDPFALELARLEHRRWCCYMASIGWAEGERDALLRRNPNLVGWDRLAERFPENCVYDLMPLLAAENAEETGKNLF